MKTIAALFVLPDSIYKTLPGVDCYDEQRDARTFDMSCPVVAHPPCRSWGKLKGLSKGSLEDKMLAPWAVDVVRKCGGVLEHPAHSSLWGFCNMPKPGYRDEFGGWTLEIDQHWFGHLTRKQTWLYIVGCEPVDIPPYSINLEIITHVIDTRKRGANRNYLYLSHKGRQATPIKMAEWLVELARRCSPTPPVNDDVTSIHHADTQHTTRKDCTK